jgi:hypothetical protein
LLAKAGAIVRIGSRSFERGAHACEEIKAAVPAGAQVTPFATATRENLQKACEGANLVIAAGAAGVELLPADVRKSLSYLKVTIDVNAVPPAGIAGVEVFDKGTEREGVICYGAIGVGGLKMKIHKAALRKLFEANDKVLDWAEIIAIGDELL